MGPQQVQIVTQVDPNNPSASVVVVSLAAPDAESRSWLETAVMGVGVVGMLLAALVGLQFAAWAAGG